MTARNRQVFEATVYHDGPINANEDQHDLGYFPSLPAAVHAINAYRDEYWQTGGVRYGFLYPAVPGKYPVRFESDDRETPWFVGTDGEPVR